MRLHVFECHGCRYCITEGLNGGEGTPFSLLSLFTIAAMIDFALNKQKVPQCSFCSVSWSWPRTRNRNETVDVSAEVITDRLSVIARLALSTRRSNSV